MATTHPQPAEHRTTAGHTPGHTETFQVVGMTCGHCASAVTGEVSAIDGVLGVDVDVPTGRVTVTSTARLTTADVRAAIDEAGYDLA